VVPGSIDTAAVQTQIVASAGSNSAYATVI
jgi:hypothetical protein